jgi:uncharacterized protein (TIGR00255 family)
MLKSMTGFSKAQATEKGIKSIVELKSLNGRYLDIKLKIPRNLAQKELQIKELIKSFLTRGTVSLVISFEYQGLKEEFAFDKDAAAAVYEELKALKKHLKIREAVKFDQVLALSQFFSAKENDSGSTVEWRIAKKALSEALKTLDKMRSQEGQEIYNDFNKRLRKIANAVDKIEKLSAQKIIDERDNQRQKIAKLFESDELDENRIQMEIAIIANRLDVSEECVRLRSHLKFFRETMKSADPIGQKLNFLLQEMNRETNTIGSKSDSAEISHIVVGVKEEIERIREQVQNIE